MLPAKFRTLFITRYPVIKEALWVFLGQLLVAVISLIGLRLITEITNPTIYGEVTLWLGIIVLLKNIFVQPVSNYQLRYYPQYFQTAQTQSFNIQIKKYYKRFSILSSSIFLVVLTLVRIINVDIVNWLFVPGLLVFFLSDSSKAYFLNIFSAERKQFLLSLFSIVDTVLLFIFLIIALLINNSAQSYLTGQAAGVTISFLLLYIYFRSVKTSKPQKEEANIGIISVDFKKYALPFIPIAILSWILNLSNRYILNSYSSLIDVGIFTAAFAISSRPFIFLSGVIGNFFRPILFEKQSKKEYAKSNRLFNLWMLAIVTLGSIILILLFFFGSIISNVFLAKDFRQNSEVLFLLIGSGYLFLVMVQAIENRLMSFEDSKSILFIYMISAIIYITANLILIPKLGSIGAGLAISVTFIMQFIIGLFYLNKTLKIKKVIVNGSSKIE